MGGGNVQRGGGQGPLGQGPLGQGPLGQMQPGGMGPGGPQGLPLNVNLEDCPDVFCPKCKCKTWTFAQMVKKVPKLLSAGTGPDRIFMQVMQCDNPECRHILKPEEFEAIK